MNDSTLKAPSRRAVARGAAWSLPVVAIAASAPVASASTTPPPPAATDLGVGGPSNPTVGKNATFFVYGIDENGGTPATYPAGTLLTVPANFTISSTSGTIQPGTSTTIIFPPGERGTVTGKFTSPGAATITASAPGFDPAELNVTVKPAA